MRSSGRFRPLLMRGWRRAFPPRDSAAAAPGITAIPPAEARGEHLRLHEAFRRRCAELGLAPDPRLFWYHTIDLGRGLVTPGSFDYRAHVGAFGFPADMSGLRVLDVGSATGFFAFDFERRGAEVTSVELPGLTSWDRFPGEPLDQILQTIRRLLPHHTVLTPDEVEAMFLESDATDLYRLLLDEPFLFCHRTLGSHVRRLYAHVHDLASLDGDGPYDLVFAGDMLLHAIDPLRALAAMASQCARTLVISQPMTGDDGPTPSLTYVGGDRPREDAAVWWMPNRAWFEHVLRRLGFAVVESIGRIELHVRPGGIGDVKTVVRAIRSTPLPPHRPWPRPLPA